jgi:hypothetical protein
MFRVHLVYGCEGNSKRCKKTAHTRDIFFVSLKKFRFGRFASFFFSRRKNHHILRALFCHHFRERERERERTKRHTLSTRRLSKVFVIASLQYYYSLLSFSSRVVFFEISTRFRYERLVKSFRPLFSVRRTLNGHKRTTRWIIIIIARRRGAKRSVKSTET